MSRIAEPTSPSALLQAVRLLAVLSVAAVVFQFVTAGQLFPDGGPEKLHAAGAIALHVLSGLAAGAAVLLWRTGQRPVWFAVLGVVVFAATFVQAAVGGRDTLWIHVPGAAIITGGTVWFLVAAWTRSAAGRRTP